MRQTILLVDDDRQLTDGLTLALERENRTIVACPDVESAELALARFSVSAVVTDIQFSGPFGFEGLHFVERLRNRLPTASIVVMTGYASDELRKAVLNAGATAALDKPFDVDDLEAVIGSPPPEAGQPFEAIRIPTIEEVLEDHSLTVVFQPIVSVADEGNTFAFEALARVRGWALGGPAELFEYAARRGHGTELNRAALVASIEAAAGLPGSSQIFLNVDPPTFSDPRLVGDILSAAGRANVSPTRIVLEITEKNALGGDGIADAAFDTLRAAGVRFALDDHGSAYSHLATIQRIRPSVIKISQSFGTGFESDETKLRVVRNVLALARDFGCSTVLEGIESGSTAAAAAALGIELGQGYFFSRPESVAHWQAAAA
jgi:EAL domain-containing protein (putative c-di-GMP-specific phosphodiesterase class I)